MSVAVYVRAYALDDKAAAIAKDSIASAVRAGGLKDMSRRVRILQPGSPPFILTRRLECRVKHDSDVVDQFE